MELVQGARPQAVEFLAQSGSRSLHSGAVKGFQTHVKHAINQLHNCTTEENLEQRLPNILAVVVRLQPFQEPLLGVEGQPWP